MCPEGLEEAPVELEAELQFVAALSVVAVLLVVPEEDRAARAEEREEEPEGEEAVERTKQHPPPPLWTQKWINTTRTEPRRKLI